MTDEELIEAAAAARGRAYAKYSGYQVGAALVDERGELHVSCNVENAAYPLGSCAEAGAIAAMVASGGARIRKIAIVGGAGEIGKCTPCGGCRQRINEFADGETLIIMRNDAGDWARYTIDDLLPESFELP